MVKNLLNTGAVFDYSADDQSFTDDLLNTDFNDSVKINETSADAEETFEDED